MGIINLGILRTIRHKGTKSSEEIIRKDFMLNGKIGNEDEYDRAYQRSIFHDTTSTFELHTENLGDGYFITTRLTVRTREIY